MLQLQDAAAQPCRELVEQKHGEEYDHQDGADMIKVEHVKTSLQFEPDAAGTDDADYRGHAHVAVKDV